MKNQWFGDEYDFRKYALLKFLSGYYDNILVSWMLTSDKQLFGMEIPEINQNEDNPMGDTARFILAHRNLKFAMEFFEEPDGKFVFWDKRIPLENTSNREIWKNELDNVQSRFIQKCLFFFDADNGCKFENTTNKDNRYVYQDEFLPLFKKGADVLLYQHRPRSMSFVQMNKVWINAVQGKIKGWIVLIKATGNVAFFLLLHNNPKDQNNNLFNDFKSIFPNPDYMSIIETKQCPTQSK